MKQPVHYFRLACAAVTLFALSVLSLWNPNTMRGESANPGHEGFCCPQTDALCIVNCHIRSNAYSVTEMQNCPSYPLVYLEGGPCSVEDPILNGTLQ